MSRRSLHLQRWHQTSDFLPVSLVPLSCYPSTGAQGQWVRVSLCTGPLGGTSWDSRSPHLTQAQSPLVFTDRSYGDFSSWHWNPGLAGGWCGAGIPHSSGGPLLPRYPSWFLSAACGCGSSPFPISTPPTSADVASSLYPYYRTSIQLDFRGFSMTAVLQLSWNSDVVVGGSAYCIYLWGHLDLNSLLHISNACAVISA